MSETYALRSQVPEDWSVGEIEGWEQEAVDRHARELARNYLETANITQATVEEAIFWTLDDRTVNEDRALELRDALLEIAKRVEREWASKLGTPEVYA